LLDPAFDEFLAAHYPKSIVIDVNGTRLTRQRSDAPLQAPLEIRLMRKRKPSALGYLVRQDHALAENQRGLAISTYGKVIRRGWDWLGMTPAAPERICGLIEVPDLSACLTLNKGDFIRTGPRGATYLAFRKAIQQGVAQQLAEWGDAPAASDQAPPREVRPLQRDLAHLLEELADDFPLLASLVERRAGGQKRLPLAARINNGDARSFVAASVSELAERGENTAEQAGPAAETSEIETPAVNESAPTFSKHEDGIQLPGKASSRSPAHYGLDIQFEDRDGDANLGRLVESTVWVNRAHPAYSRALASRSIGYHIALSVAMSLAPLAVEPAQQSQFLLTFLRRWGEAIEKPASRQRMKRG
jgi:hypothetical protein